MFFASLYSALIIAFWLWVVKKILDLDKRTKEISLTLRQISEKLSAKSSNSKE